MARRFSAWFEVVALDERLAAVELIAFERRRSIALRLKLCIWASASVAGAGLAKAASYLAR